MPVPVGSGGVNAGGGDKMRFGRMILALAFSMAMLLTAISVPAPVRGSVTQLELVPGKYTGASIYVPGEVMDIVIHGDAVNEEFEVYSVIGEEQQIGGNVFIQESLTAKVSYVIPNAPDGDYIIRVKRPNGAVEAEVTFTIQGYSFDIETDRNAYLSGDELRVFWTANSLKDQTLPASGDGTINIYSVNDTGVFSKFLGTHKFTEAAGSVSFTLPDIVNYTHKYTVIAWFNDTAVPPKRSQSSLAHFEVKRLGAIIELDKGQYTTGSLLRMKVTTLAAENNANPSLLTDTNEPGCSVSIEIKRAGMVTPTFSPVVLITDSHGLVEYVVALNNPEFADGVTFNVEVTASKGVNSIFVSDSFIISSTSSISVGLDFNRKEYASGETLFVNATASSIGSASTSYTYIIEIRDNDTAGTLLSRDTQSSGDFYFDIPVNLEGWLWVRVTVDDGSGNSASVVQRVRVDYAIVLVNVNKENYNAGDELRISYSVISSLLGNPATFYVVYDKEGSIVDEGTAANGSFGFTVPGAPSASYVFTVFASGEGRVVQGSDSANLFSGYVLLLRFNRAYYGPGDTIAVDYEIIVMGNAKMPATFTITYGLVNGPEASLQTGERKGSLTYVIPGNIDQGDQIFLASCDFGASSNEVIVVDGSVNPMSVLKIFGIPLFNMLLLLLLLFTLYVALRTRARVKRLQKEGISAEPAISPLSPRRPQQDSGDQRINCAECGNPIEITTSRRPIEVMCPHCGEIQHIE